MEFLLTKCKLCSSSVQHNLPFSNITQVAFMSRYNKHSAKRPRSPLSFRPNQDRRNAYEDSSAFDELEPYETNDFLYGVYPCLLALKHKSRIVHRAFVRKDYFQTDTSRIQNPSKMLLGVRSILDILERERIPVMLYNRAALSFMSGGGDKPHQGVVLEVSPREITEVTEENMQATLQLLEKQQHVFILDGIRDPMNLGAILRTLCFLAGPKNSVILTPQCSILSPACAKASSGAVELLNFHKSRDTSQLIDLLKSSQNRVVIGTDEPGPKNVDLDDICRKLSMAQRAEKLKIVIVFGFEGSGVSKELLNKCDHVVSVSSFGTGTEVAETAVNSLNVSAAFSIVLYKLLEISSQQNLD